MMDIIPSKEELQKTYAAIKGIELPTVPDIVQKANAELSKPDPNISELAELVSKDPVLSGQILKVINSPFYGLSKKIESVQKAVVLLGQKNLKNVLMTAGLRQAMSGSDDSRKTFWDRAAATAACASGIASMVHNVQADEAYMTGLFLDTGVLVLLEKSPAYKRVSDNQPMYPYSTVIFEENKFETNHPNVGYLLALSWKIPDASALAILHHHTKELEAFEDNKLRALIAIMQLSYCLVAEELSETEMTVPEHLKFKEGAIKELLLNESDLQDIVVAAVREST